jgi:hypothetical protein
MDSLDENGSPIIVDHREFPIVRVVITDVRKDAYDFEVFFPGFNYSSNGTIWLMK